MAKVTQCLGIDIGSHSIRVAELAIGKNGVEIKKLAETRLTLEPGQPEAERHAAISSQLSELLKSNRIKSKQAVFCVPGQTVFIRRRKLPMTTPDRLHRIILFEAREQIPYPLEKTVLEYQVFEVEGQTEAEVLLVAIKRDYIENFMKMVRKTKIKPLYVSVSSLALHNFHELNGSKKILEGRLGEVTGARKKAELKQTDKTKKAKKGLSFKFGKKKAKADEEPISEELEAEEVEPYDSMEFEEIQAQINLGASTMDLAIPKAGSERLIGFTRTVPMGGTQIDRAIQSKLGLGALAEAHDLKEKEAVILASDFELSGDADSVNMPASEAATTVVDRIVTEIRRSLDFFISTPDGVAADSIILSGGLSGMRFLSNYIEEKMGLPVEAASIKNEMLAIPEDVAEAVPSFVIPIGLALQGLEMGQVKIDFLPQDIKNVRALGEKKVQIGLSSLFLVGSVFLSCQTGDNYLRQNNGLAEGYQAEISRAAASSKQIEEILAKNSLLADKFKKMAGAIGPRRLWLDFTLIFLQCRPPDVLIEWMTIPKTGLIEVRGLTPRKNKIATFLNNLNGNVPRAADYVHSSKLVYLGDAIDDPRFKTKVFPFTVRVSSWNRQGRYRSIKRTEADEPTGPQVFIPYSLR